MKLHRLQEKLSKLKCFTPIDIKRFSGLSEKSVHKIIWRYTKKGIIVRLRNGIYIFKSNPLPPLWYIANRIYQPSYISFETALSYYGLIPESIYAVTSATSKITRNFEIDNKEFIYRKIKKDAFTGYKPVEIEDEITNIAEPEKALSDYLYFVYLKKISFNERINIKKINKKLVMKYVNIFKNKPFLKWIKAEGPLLFKNVI